MSRMYMHKAPPDIFKADPPKDLGAAQERISGWAQFCQGGALFTPGPAGYSRPMGSTKDHGSPFLADYELIEKHLVGKQPNLRAVLQRVYWRGEDPGANGECIEEFVREIADALTS